MELEAGVMRKLTAVGGGWVLMVWVKMGEMLAEEAASPE